MNLAMSMHSANELEDDEPTMIMSTILLRTLLAETARDGSVDDEQTAEVVALDPDDILIEIDDDMFDGAIEVCNDDFEQAFAALTRQ